MTTHTRPRQSRIGTEESERAWQIWSGIDSASRSRQTRRPCREREAESIPLQICHARSDSSVPIRDCRGRVCVVIPAFPSYSASSDISLHCSSLLLRGLAPELGKDPDLLRLGLGLIP